MAESKKQLLSDEFLFQYVKTVSNRLEGLCFAYTFLWWIAGCLILVHNWTGSLLEIVLCAISLVATVMFVIVPEGSVFRYTKDYAKKAYLHSVTTKFQVVCALIFWCNIVMLLAELTQNSAVTTDFLVLKVMGIFSVFGFVLCPDPNDFLR